MNSKTAAALLAVAAICATGFSACDDDTTDEIGSSLVQTESSVDICSDFTLEGKSVENNRVQSRTISQLIGKIDANGYGTLSSDFVTQLMPAATLDSMLTSAEEIDSLKLLMLYNKGSYVGDSIVPMGMEVYRLNRQLVAPIFSNFNPADYYNPSEPIGSKIYGASDLSYNDTLSTSTYNALYVDLPRSLAVELFDLYKSNPSAYLSPTEFAKYFPGLYVKSNYGSGRVTSFGATALELFYHYPTVNTAGNDTIISTSGVFYQATPEIISNNNINLAVDQSLKDRMNAGEQLLIAPAGYDVELTFPVREIIDYYNANRGVLSVLNTLTMSIPVETIANDYGIEPPEYILLVKKSEKTEFFEQNKITNGTTSFYAQLNTATGSYEFSSLRQYLIDCINKGEKLTADDYTFIITPVEVQTETQSSYYQTTTTVTAITPYITGPAMVRLRLDKATTTLTFSNQQ